MLCDCTVIRTVRVLHRSTPGVLGWVGVQPPGQTPPRNRLSAWLVKAALKMHPRHLGRRLLGGA